MAVVYSRTELCNQLIPVFKKYQVQKAVLFGSYRKGNATERSDVDLLVESGLKGLAFVGLIEAVRQATDKDIDLFDGHHIEAGSEIAREIEKDGVVIYEA